MSNLKLAPSNRSGMGVFTTTRIPARVPVIEEKGNFFNKNNLIEHPANLQIGNDLFLGPSGGIDDFVNHSCDPNCYLHIVGKRAILYSLYVIPANTEITFDYSTSSTDTMDEWCMDCNCGSIKCRKKISGIQYLDPKLVEEYKKKGMIPLFLRTTIFR